MMLVTWGPLVLLTVTAHFAYLPLPSTAMAVMLAVPAPTAVTLPLLSTVATALLSELQFTPLLLALLGVTLAVRFSVSPTFMLRLLELKLTLVTNTGPDGTSVTVTAHFAYLPLPSAAMAVMLAVPAPFAVTLPLLSTVATAFLSELQFTSLLVALLGVTLAVRLFVSPTFMLRLLELKLTLVTGTAVAANKVSGYANIKANKIKHEIIFFTYNSLLNILTSYFLNPS
ncbi:MAG: hypothetical protein A4E52_01502 [Pelotomaculum sp. PtaB.Bin013]|nr:MAG: hypothetical protein A4E52_01502 [Pelotomaculum sp. PtaB.Bin013]